MDTEQQVRLNFLEEVVDYFDQIETVALKLTTAELDTAELDRAMRAAHSIKGGAGMMGFVTLSQIAHRLEDFFKILRLRGASLDIDAQLESLFLEGVDALRLVARHNRQGGDLDASFMEAQIQPIFAQLRAHLGDLRPEDEERLLAQEENVDVAVIIFSGGVEDCLDELEAKLAQIPDPQMAAELIAAAEQLAEFGRMSELDSFVQLCEAVQSYTPQVKDECLAAFAQSALSTWRRSHALVLVGRTRQLPHTVAIEASWLSTRDQTSAAKSTHSRNYAQQSDATEVTENNGWPDPDMASEMAELDYLDLLDEENLSALQDLVGNFGTADSDYEFTQEIQLQQTPKACERIDVAPSPLGDQKDLLLETAEEATENPPVMSAASQTEIQGDALPTDPVVDAFEVAEELQPLLDEPDLSTDKVDSLAATNAGNRLPNTLKTSIKHIEASPEAADSTSTATNTQQNTTVRVSAQQLQQLNTLFGKLVVERNAIDLRLSQLHDLVALMQDRMGQLEQSNHQLQHWYDRASTTGLMSAPVALETSSKSVQPLEASLVAESRSQLRQQFDALELDQYTDLHLLSQEQMERIVQLQEVSSDLTFSLREARTATAALHYTTRALQSGMTKIQMRPFSTLVKRFPRVVRDLAVQHNKQVNLDIQGEMTLIDRVAVEALADPLNHLLRNAFDHGIETAEERIAAGKPEKGTIAIRALHRGNQTLITIQDDGRGIDLAKIRDRLNRLGMPLAEVQKLSDRDLLNLIFEPGFSTAEQVTELSGRGVGMDIVRTNLQSIRGDIRVATQMGQGTTITIQVPLAVSVLRVMLVESARLVFAVPVDSIQGMVSLPPERSRDRKPLPETQPVTWEEQAVHLVRLEDWLKFNSAAHALKMEGIPTINQPTALVINHGGQLQGLCIDCFWGEQEISLSPLKSPVKLPAGFSGTSILGDGRVIPLVDPYQLLESIAEQQKARRLALATEARLVQPIPPLSVAATMSRQLPSVLIVDDSINVRRYLALTLEKAGYQVEQAKDGQDAIDKLMAGLKAEVVVCDIEMPRLDGYGVLSELRSRPAYQHLPIAMLTSRMNDKHRKLAMNLGASAYFSKPYNEQELLKTLQALIETAKTQPTGTPVPA